MSDKPIDPEVAAAALRQEMAAEREADELKKKAARKRRAAQHERDNEDTIYKKAWKRAFFWTILLLPFFPVVFVIFLIMGIFQMAGKGDEVHTGRGYLRGSLIGFVGAIGVSFLGFFTVPPLIAAWEAAETAEYKARARQWKIDHAEELEAKKAAVEQAARQKQLNMEVERKRKAAEQQAFLAQREKARAEVAALQAKAAAEERDRQEMARLERERLDQMSARERAAFNDQRMDQALQREEALAARRRARDEANQIQTDAKIKELSERYLVNQRTVETAETQRDELDAKIKAAERRSEAAQQTMNATSSAYYAWQNSQRTVARGGGVSVVQDNSAAQAASARKYQAAKAEKERMGKVAREAKDALRELDQASELAARENKQIAAQLAALDVALPVAKPPANDQPMAQQHRKVTVLHLKDGSTLHAKNYAIMAGQYTYMTWDGKSGTVAEKDVEKVESTSEPNP